MIRSQNFPGGFATQRGSYYKTAPYTQILKFGTLAPSLSFPFPDTTPNPSTTTPQLPSIASVIGGYRFSHGRTNQKCHEMPKIFSSIRLLALKIFTRTSVSFPTDMQPPRSHSTTTRVGKHNRHGALSQFVATEVSQFVLYFLVFFGTIPPPSWTSYWDAVGTPSLHTPGPDTDRDIPYVTVFTTWYVLPPFSPLPYPTWNVPSTSWERRRGWD